LKIEFWFFGRDATVDINTTTVTCRTRGNTVGRWGGGGGGRGEGGRAGGGEDGKDLGAGHEACFDGAVDLVAYLFTEHVEESVEDVSFQLCGAWWEGGDME
jgi:hypothetical protein